MTNGLNLEIQTSAFALFPVSAGQEHILEQEGGKKRWVQVVTELSRAFAFCAASDEATATGIGLLRNSSAR